MKFSFPLTLMHGKISSLRFVSLYDYQTQQLKPCFNQIRSSLFFAQFKKSQLCALIFLTLAKAVDDTDRKSRHQTNRFPSFILRVQEKRKTSYELRKACVELQLHKSCSVLFCVKLETKDKSSLFGLNLTKFFLLYEHNGMC